MSRVARRITESVICVTRWPPVGRQRPGPAEIVESFQRAFPSIKLDTLEAGDAWVNGPK
jgi:hypothetical protein